MFQLKRLCFDIVLNHLFLVKVYFVLMREIYTDDFHLGMEIDCREEILINIFCSGDIKTIRKQRKLGGKIITFSLDFKDVDIYLKTNTVYHIPIFIVVHSFEVAFTF